MENRKRKSGLIAKLANYECLYGYFIAAKKNTDGFLEIAE